MTVFACAGRRSGAGGDRKRAGADDRAADGPAWPSAYLPTHIAHGAMQPAM